MHGRQEEYPSLEWEQKFSCSFTHLLMVITGEDAWERGQASLGSRIPRKFYSLQDTLTPKWCLSTTEYSSRAVSWTRTWEGKKMRIFVTHSGRLILNSSKKEMARKVMAWQSWEEASLSSSSLLISYLNLFLPLIPCQMDSQHVLCLLLIFSRFSMMIPSKDLQEYYSPVSLQSKNIK